MEKSANKKWKESGTTLSFKEWIDRENKKKEDVDNFLPFDASQSVQDTINQTLESSRDEIQTITGSTNKPNKSKVLGLDRNILVFSTLLIIGSFGFYIYKKRNK